MSVWKKTFVITGLVLGMTAHGANLQMAYQDALKNDPTFKKAQADMMTNKEIAPQALASLLTTVSGSATGTTSRGTSNNLTSLIATKNYQSASTRRGAYSLNLNQPVFDFTKIMHYASAKASAQAADATFAAAAQNLVRRVAVSYFDVLQKQQLLTFAKANQKSLQRQLDQARARFKVGTNTIKDVYEAEAKYNIAEAQTIADQNHVADSIENLGAITGVTYKTFSPVKAKLPLVKPAPANISVWTKRGIQGNLTLKSDALKTLAAKRAIKQAFGGHLPSVDLDAAYDRSASHYNSNDATGIVTSASAALTLNVPVFQGGLVNSEVRQARDQYSSAYQQQNIDYRRTVAQTRQDYLGVLATISQINADKRSIISSQSALKSAEAEFKVGTATMLDVLTQQSNVFLSQSNHAKDMFQYIGNYIRLKQDAGLLSPADIDTLNGWLKQKA